MSLKPPTDICLEQHINFIKKHKLGYDQLAYKYTVKEIGQICEYIGLRPSNEKEVDKAKLLLSHLYKRSYNAI